MDFFSFNQSYFFDGNVSCDEYGICNTFGHSTITHRDRILFNEKSSAFTFSILGVSCKEFKSIVFGIRLDNDKSIEIDYFPFLANTRIQFPELPLGIDGLCIPIRMYCTSGIIQIHVCGIIIQTMHIDGNGYYYIKSLSSHSRIMTPFSKIVDSSWFPYLLPPKWRCQEQSMFFRRFLMRKIKSDCEYSLSLANDPLYSLPGTGVVYFEIHSSNGSMKQSMSSVLIGFSDSIPERFKCDILPNYIGFRTDTGYIFQGDNKIQIPIPESPNEIVIGFGIVIRAKMAFVTFNGIICESNLQLSDLPEKFYPIVGLASTNDIAKVNFGQHQFKYTNLHPIEGWCLYKPIEDKKFIRAPECFCHIYGYFRDFGLSKSVPETMVFEEALNSFEVSMHRVSNSKGFTIGFSNINITSDAIIGLAKDSYGYSFQNGWIGSEKKLINETLKEGNSYYLESGNMCAIMHSAENIYEFPLHSQSTSLHPSISTFSGTFQFFVNTGLVPYHFEKPSGNTKLFNGALVELNLSDSVLSPFGLMFGDIVESRDRCFLGKCVGFFRDRPFFEVNGISGAVCLNSPDPLFYLLLLKVVFRPAEKRLLSPILVVNNIEFVNIGAESPIKPFSIVCSSLPSIFMGLTLNEIPVLRPISDLIQSKIIGLSTDPMHTLQELFPSVNTSMFQSTQLIPFDIVGLKNGKVAIVIGSSNGIPMVLSSTLSPLGETPKLLFRFFGFDRGYDFGSSEYYSSSLQCFVRAGMSLFSNSFDGVIGSHIVYNQAVVVSPLQIFLKDELPPYVFKVFQFCFKSCDSQQIYTRSLAFQKATDIVDILFCE